MLDFIKKIIKRIRTNKNEEGVENRKDIKMGYNVDIINSLIMVLVFLLQFEIM